MQNTPINTGRKADGTFAAGNKANPAGRPKGSRNQATIAAQALLDGEAENLTRVAVELALGGDITALRLCLERICPARKETPIELDLPAVKTSSDLVIAQSAIADAVASGHIAPSEGRSLADIFGAVGKSIELNDMEARIRALEERTKK